MATRARRPCSASRCPHFTPCPVHTRAASHRLYDQARGTAGQRGYGAAWRRVRAQVLVDEPLCRRCADSGHLTAASEVHHIRPRDLGGSDDRENLMPVCHACHMAIQPSADQAFRR